MSQTRYINFGDTLLADRVNKILTSLVEPGVLSGADFSLFDAETLSISPHRVMLTSVLLEEDSSLTLEIPLTSPARNYTVAYEHVNVNTLGGAAANLLLIDGIFAFGELANTVILGWVRYPGGSVPLSLDFFVEAPKLQIRNPVQFPTETILPPYSSKVHLKSESPTPGSISAVDVFDTVNNKAYLELENTAASIQTRVYYFPFIARERSPDRILIEARAELGAQVTATLIAEDGTEFAATDNAISNTSNVFEFREMDVIDLDTSKFAPNRPYFVSLAIRLNPGRKAFISIVGTNVNFLPF